MRKGKGVLLVLMAMWGIATAVAAGAEPARIELPQDAPLLGGWTGKIGKHRVLVCFVPSNSSYYYASQLVGGRGLMLVAEDAQGRSWRETEMLAMKPEPTGYWKLDVPRGDVLAGQWSGPHGGATLPIRLEKTKSADVGPKACDFLAMQAKLGFHPLRVAVGPVAEMSGVRYRMLSSLDGTVTSIQFVDEGGKYAAHNAKLKKDFEEQIRQGLECQRAISATSSMLGWPSSYQVEPVSVRGTRWVTLRVSESGFCGGAHPYADSELATVDVYSGKPLVLDRWLRHDEDGMLPAKLDHLIATRILKKRGGGDDDCAGVYTGGEDGRGEFPGYSIALGNAGLVFYKSLPHVVYACTEEVEIPFAQLAPFLSKAGKAGVKLMQQGAAPAPGTEKR